MLPPCTDVRLTCVSAAVKMLVMACVMLLTLAFVPKGLGEHLPDAHTLGGWLNWCQFSSG
jgi:hypothetical protein